MSRFNNLEQECADGIWLRWVKLYQDAASRPMESKITEESPSTCMVLYGNRSKILSTSSGEPSEIVELWLRIERESFIEWSQRGLRHGSTGAWSTDVRPFQLWLRPIRRFGGRVQVQLKCVTYSSESSYWKAKSR